MQRDPTVGRQTLVARRIVAGHRGERRDHRLATTSASAAWASAESKDARAVERCHDHLGGQRRPWSDCGGRVSRSIACWESTPGHLERVLELAAERSRRADDEH